MITRFNPLKSGQSLLIEKRLNVNDDTLCFNPLKSGQSLLIVLFSAVDKVLEIMFQSP